MQDCSVVLVKCNPGISLATSKITRLYFTNHQELGRRPYQPAHRARWVARADVVLFSKTTKRYGVDPPPTEGFLFSESTLPPALIQAYRETDYRVLAETPFVLTVGIASQDLIRLYQAHKVACAAFVTAFNPFSQELTADENHRRQAELAKELTRLGLEFVEGVGQHPGGNWPGEASFLVFGLALEAAKSLGHCMEQHASV